MSAEVPIVRPCDSLEPLPRSFFERPTLEVARELPGKLLVRPRAGGLAVARLVEVEAYLGEHDAASHARRGPTPRAAIMFGPPGRLYVYLIYGMHHCMNVVTEIDGVAGAVLLRAAAPVRGITRSLRGPGNLCAGLEITRAQNGLDLTTGTELWLADDGARPRLSTSPRIGVAYAGAWARRLLRFYVPGDPNVSRAPGPRARAR